MIPTKIRIDLDGQKDINVPITLSAGDTNAYGLILEFLNGGQPYDITGFNLAVFAKRAGSNTPIADVGTVTGGKGYYVIKPSMYIYSGETQLEIVLTDTGTSVVTKVLHFPVRSGFSINGGSVVDEVDYSVLMTLIQQAQSSIQQADYFTAYAQAQGDYAKSVADGVKSGFSIKIAASNASDESKVVAKYVCDGTADEVEINQAIQDLALTGGCVELSEGTFNLSAPVLINVDNIGLKGQGMATKISSVSEGVGTGIDISSFAFNTIIYGLAVFGFSRGIYNSGDINTITSCHCYNNALAGILNVGNFATITSCVCISNGKGIMESGEGAATINNCICNDNQIGISIEGNNTTVTSCTCVDNTSIGIANDTNYELYYGAIITNNRCLRNGSSDILNNMEVAIVANNIVTGGPL